ncbi:hypothetical protein COI63_25390 [Bacillus toyonensis]|nr:hypothetical protein CN594_26425 [Bacillus toyonensis]PFY36889.1 hypothetical protein COL55_28445 [Bacillus toyonensis]PFY43850.1 hypothetical protein COL54_12465 [Bacillus toyonensis]PFY73575.1 hypothetical protein COL62_24370 [Bacillus toyonensis]PGD22118.1 hypothetical protein COM37_11225 [Bacillus toyonensis]
MTPKEFYYLMNDRTEKIYDQLEIEAVKSLMMRMVYHHDPKKELKPEDLFKRPDAESKQRETAEDLKEKVKHQEEWLSQFTFTPVERGG